jgi:hypothetical protein
LGDLAILPLSHWKDTTKDSKGTQKAATAKKAALLEARPVLKAS